jgi:trans-aconitate 2-methyltransferase
MVDWSPGQYLKFGGERTQPSIDLAAKIRVDSAESILDVGCGPGNSTQVLRLRWPHAEITGLDASGEMIERARESYPQGKWIVGDASKLDRGQGYDIVFSNAALQWIRDHNTLIPRLFSLVRRNGAMAVQVPANSRSPLHLALLSVSRKPEWHRFTAGCQHLLHYHSPEYYYGLLRPLAARAELWETIYYHMLSGHSELVEWYKGSGMRPFLERLPDELARSAFENEVLEACRSFYPVREHGKILYPFRRIFFIAYAS